MRSQAEVDLKQIGSDDSLPALRSGAEYDRSRDVRHQSELTMRQIERKIPATGDLAAAYDGLNESNFCRVKEDRPAVDFDDGGKARVE